MTLDGPVIVALAALAGSLVGATCIRLTGGGGGFCAASGIANASEIRTMALLMELWVEFIW